LRQTKNINLNFLLNKAALLSKKNASIVNLRHFCVFFATTNHTTAFSSKVFICQQTVGISKRYKQKGIERKSAL
jgi:hypothetical protein